MEIEVDKKGVRSALELAVVGVVIVIAAHLIAGQWGALAPAPGASEQASAPLAGIPDAASDTNSFYINPSGAAPVFLSSGELAKKQEALTWEKRDFAVVDEGAGRVSFYAGGVERVVFPIVSMPSPGSFFDIPAGFYTVQGKAADHTEKNGRTHLSWAVYLYGNYLISAVSPRAGVAAAAPAPERAGIGLASAHAKEFFGDVADGMPVLVVRRDAPAPVSFGYFRKTLLPHAVPEVSAASALAADLETGEILFEKNKNDAYPTASLTKLMTAVIAEEEVKPDRLLAVGDESLATYGNSAGLVRGEVFRAGDLLHGLILESSNDIAVMFQLAVPGFIAKMNEKAKALGLSDKTFFEDSSGLSQNNTTTAADLFTLLRRINKDHPGLLVLSRDRTYAVTSGGKKKNHVWGNVNWPAGDRRYLGGKAGFTDESIQTMAGVWIVRMAEYGGREIAITLLGSRNRVQDVRAVIAYLEKNFVYGFASAADTKGRSAAFSGAEGASVYEAVRSWR